MRRAIVKSQTQGTPQQGNNVQNTNMRRPAGQVPQRFYFEPTRDPNVMDIDYMSTKDQTEMTKKGLCFKCGKPGHRAKDPQYHPEQ